MLVRSCAGACRVDTDSGRLCEHVTQSRKRRIGEGRGWSIGRTRRSDKLIEGHVLVDPTLPAAERNFDGPHGLERKGSVERPGLAFLLCIIRRAKRCEGGERSKRPCEQWGYRSVVIVDRRMGVLRLEIGTDIVAKPASAARIHPQFLTKLAGSFRERKMHQRRNCRIPIKSGFVVEL